MHFVLYVVTEDRPTEEALAAALAPFGPEGEARWDSWVLGGRYTGNLMPHDIENTVTGGPEVSDAEFSLIRLFETVLPDERHSEEKAGKLVSTRPGRTGLGVDALQICNLKEIPEIGPFAILVDGKWHQCGTYPILDMFKRYHLDVKSSVAEIAQDQDALTAWREQVCELMDRVPLTHWLAVVDCHTWIPGLFEDLDDLLPEDWTAAS